MVLAGYRLQPDVGMCVLGRPRNDHGGEEEPGMRDIGWFNGLPPALAEAELVSCCASADWARAIAAARPYPGLAALVRAAMTSVRALDDAHLDEALAAHPRIGDRSGGGREATEQAGVIGAGDDTLRALADGNRAYEDRFDRVFLICATGRGAADMLAELRGRLLNDSGTESSVVRDELAKITELRLRRLLTDGTDGTERTGSTGSTGSEEAG
jgi:2-oxo-4-hydroxy-4-carboxy-5-ureidoimidazoline decarboxylase